jgi:hypothetical protein
MLHHAQVADKMARNFMVSLGLYKIGWFAVQIETSSNSSTDTAQSVRATSRSSLENEARLNQQTEFRELFELPTYSATEHVTADLCLMPPSSKGKSRHGTKCRGKVFGVGSLTG